MSMPRRPRRGRVWLRSLLGDARTHKFLTDVATSVTSTLVAVGIIYLLGALGGYYKANPVLVYVVIFMLGVPLAVGVGWELLGPRSSFWTSRLGVLVLVFALVAAGGLSLGAVLPALVVAVLMIIAGVVGLAASDAWYG
jgi:hypothetical protein